MVVQRIAHAGGGVMALCTWCQREMTTAMSCTVDAFHRSGRRLAMIPFGRESGPRTSATRCGSCGVGRGGWHHPGCDLQRCPACRHQMMSCGCRFDEDATVPAQSAAEPFGVDGNGLLTERMSLGDMQVVIHRDDVPETDITTVKGIRCTTALRTVIDLAPEVAPTHLAKHGAGLSRTRIVHRRRSLASPGGERHGQPPRRRTAAAGTASCHRVSRGRRCTRRGIGRARHRQAGAPPFSPLRALQQFADDGSLTVGVLVVIVPLAELGGERDLRRRILRARRGVVA